MIGKTTVSGGRVATFEDRSERIAAGDLTWGHLGHVISFGTELESLGGIFVVITAELREVHHYPDHRTSIVIRSTRDNDANTVALTLPPGASVTVHDDELGDA